MVDAKKYVEQISKNRLLIANKMQERSYWLDMAAGISPKMGGERVQSSGSKQTMESQVVEAVRIDEEIAKMKAEIKSIIRTMEKLKADEYDVLFKRYVLNRTWREIAEVHGCSVSWVYSIHKEALKDLQKLLDEEKSQG